MTLIRNLLSSTFTILVSGLLFASLFSSCGSDGHKKGNSDDADYVEKINAWNRERISALKEEDGWLTLAGLYPLEQGTYTFGADSSNEIVFPGKETPATIGRLNVEKGKVSIRINRDVTVRSDGIAVSDTTLKSDKKRQPTILTHGTLQWYVIERGGQLYLRLKDTDHPNLASFNGIERFPVSRKWRVEARFQAFNQPDTMGIPNVLGQINKDPLFGMLEFELNGNTYTLAPLGNPETDEEFFIIFGDATNGEETYSGGRFVYADTPDENGKTYIDFNKAYNPPCVFTPFATCPLPPPRNRLEVEIRAGEKNYDGSAHEPISEEKRAKSGG